MATTFHHRDLKPGELVAAKDSTTVTVALPARNEAETIGPIIDAIHRELVIDNALVDELLVIDDHSSDATARIATEAGAQVIGAESILPEFGEGHGKGEALWKSLFVSTGDVISWCDSDIREFDTRFVLGPLGPLLLDPDVGFVKSFYHRPGVDRGGGGRVTELMARPTVASLFPHLSHLVQPLSGEFAGRRELLEQVPFSQGYAVDLALLIDISDRFGTDCIAQVDLGTRIHRNRTLEELGPQATAILAMALKRAGLRDLPPHLELRRPGLDDTLVEVGDRPPLATVRAQSAADESS